MKAWFKRPKIALSEVGSTIYEGNLLSLTIETDGWGWLRISSSRHSSKLLRFLKSLFWPLFGSVGKAVSGLSVKVIVPTGKHRITVLVPCEEVLYTRMFNLLGIDRIRFTTPSRSDGIKVTKLVTPPVMSVRPELGRLPEVVVPGVPVIRNTADGIFPISPAVKNIRCTEHVSVFNSKEKEGIQ